MADRQRSSARAVYLLIVLVAAYIVAFLDRQIIALLVTPIKMEFGISDFEVGLLQGLAFSLSFSIATLPVGWLVDRGNRKAVLLFGIAIWTVMTIFCGLANSFWLLFLGRIGVGLGEACLSPAAYSMIIDSFSRERTVRALTIFSMAGTLGVGAAFLGGGAAIEAINSLAVLPIGIRPWQAGFLLVSLPGFLVLAAALFVKEPMRKMGAAAPQTQLRPALRSLWADRRIYAPIYCCSVLLGVAYFAAIAWFAAHLIRFYGFTAPAAGRTLGILFLCTTVTGTLCGTWATERFARRGHKDAPLRTVMFISFLAIPTSLAATIPNLFVSLGVLAVGMASLGSFYGNLVAALQLVTPASSRGVNSSVFILCNSLGSFAIGAALVGGLSDHLFAGMPQGVGYSVSIVSILCTCLSAFVAAKSLARFARSMAASEQEQPNRGDGKSGQRASEPDTGEAPLIAMSGVQGETAQMQ
ncbi:MFS transporter [Sphingobium mellinum]|uniref:MFS transporter n=1 Tax=Sphingobium mellinum TaxID=1387166 RepID=UPI0030EE884B